MKSIALCLTSVLIAFTAGCGVTSSDTRGGSSGPNGRPPAVRLDPKTPIEVGDRKAMIQWIDDRIQAAKAGRFERVRIPAIHTDAIADCDCPTFAIAASPGVAPFYWLDPQGGSGAELQPGQWSAWVEGRFTGEERMHAGSAGGAAIALPVFQLLGQSPRGGEPALVRVL